MDERAASTELEPISYLRRFGARFLGLYIVLFFFPSPFNVVPLLGGALVSAAGAWRAAVAWIGQHAFRLGPVPVPASSCGDFLVDYVQLAVTGIVACLGACAWAWRPSRVEHERQLWAALRVYARYVLGFTMLNYSVAKLFPIQFNDLGPHALETPVGEGGLMGIYWVAMSASPLYGFFGGAAELAGGLLVLFRRTALLGALVVVGVMSNVVALNVGYDICVKVFSTHCLLLAVFLAAPDLRWVMRTLTSRADAAVYGGRPRARIVARGVKLALLACVLAASVRSVVAAYHDGRIGAPKSPLFGAWNVVTFTRDGVPRAACEFERERWRLVLIERSAFSIETIDGKRLRFKYSYDDERRVLDLSDRRTDTHRKLRVTGTAPDLTFEDEADGLRVTLKRKARTDYPLLEDRIDLINDKP